MSASVSNTTATETKASHRFVPLLDGGHATVEEMDDWITALGGRVVTDQEMRDIIQSVRWAHVPGENPGDPEFPFAKHL